MYALIGQHGTHRGMTGLFGLRRKAGVCRQLVVSVNTDTRIEGHLFHLTSLVFGTLVIALVLW